MSAHAVCDLKKPPANQASKHERQKNLPDSGRDTPQRLVSADQQLPLMRHEA